MKTIVLFSGGIDSTVVLAMALSQGKECLAISFEYGQRHKIELKAAAEIAHHYGVAHQIISIDRKTFSTSSLTDGALPIKGRTVQEIADGGIPTTYVPARNTLFLAYAAGQAEIFSANEIAIGANKMDFLPYPDCRPDYFKAFQNLLCFATKQGVEGNPPVLLTPLLDMTKEEIVKKGIALRAPLHLTFSCYSPTSEDLPCRSCDACVLRDEALRAVLTSSV